MSIVSGMPRAVRTAMNETRRDTLVYIASFLCLDPTLVANQRKAAVERWRRQASDTPACAVLEVDFGADKILRGRRKNLGRGAGCDAHRLAGKRHEHVAKMNPERCPGAGRSVTGVAPPVRRIHFPKIGVTHIGVHVQNTAECSAVKQTTHFLHRGLVPPLVTDTKHATGFCAGGQNPLRAGGGKREWLFTKNLLAGLEGGDRHFFVQKVRGHDRDRSEERRVGKEGGGGGV